MPHLDDEVLARALAVISRGASPGDTIVDPFTPLEREGLPREAVIRLIQRRCLTGQGRLRFRLDRIDLPPPKSARTPSPPPVVEEEPDAPDELPDLSLTAPLATPAPAAAPLAATPPAARTARFLLVVDVENVAKTCRDLRAPFRPEVVRAIANQCGEVAFAFALGNLLAINKRDQELLTLAGFPLLHCARLPDGNGGKDTVDENAQDLIGRFIEHSSVDGVILVTDDRNFIPIMVRVRDRGRKLIRIAVRTGTELDRMGEVRHLPLHDGEAAEGAAAPARPWAPQLIIDGLQTLLSIATPLERERAIRNMSLQVPLVHRLLRAFLRRRWSTRTPDWLTGFLALLDDLDAMVLGADRVHVTKEDLRAFLTALNDIGVIEKVEGEKHGRRQVGYRPNWSHPFCAHVVADIQDRGSRFRRRDDRRERVSANGSNGSSDDHASAAVPSAGTPDENPR